MAAGLGPTKGQIIAAYRRRPSLVPKSIPRIQGRPINNIRLSRGSLYRVAAAKKRRFGVVS
jgi:hypothetical protein